MFVGVTFHGHHVTLNGRAVKRNARQWIARSRHYMMGMAEDMTSVVILGVLIWTLAPLEARRSIRTCVSEGHFFCFAEDVDYGGKTEWPIGKNV